VFVVAPLCLSMTWRIVTAVYILRRLRILGCPMLNPILERVHHSGAWIVSDFIGGYRVARTYYGFNGAQALRAFLDEFGGE
jgi:hypothetical protein